MGIIIDPRTRQRIVRAKHSGDIVYELNPAWASNAVVQEDVFLLGQWTDYTGSDTTISARERQLTNTSINLLKGSDAQIDGNARDFPRTDRGKRKITHRQRNIDVYHE